MNKVINFIIWPTVAGVVFAIVLLQLPKLSVWFPSLPNYLPQQPPLPITQLAPQSNSISYSSAIKRAAPAVVSIDSKQSLSKTYLVNRQFFITRNYDESSLGSGVIISPDGFIITSNHIINATGSTQIVTLSDGREIDARPVIIDEQNDLALLKIDAQDLPSINFGNPSNIEVGDIVLAIGNPRNIGQSVSLGIVSAKLRLDDSYVIQTDAAINPGNSGGALIDIQGNLIGINSTIISESGGSEGIGFAVPANKATELLHIYNTRELTGYLGIDSFLLSGSPIQGFRIDEVFKDSPAELAGIQAGDVITGANDKSFNMEDEANTLEAISYLGSFKPNQKAMIKVLRGDETLEIPVIFSEESPIVLKNYSELPVDTPQQSTNG